MNHCISFDDTGKMHVRYNPNEMIKQSGVRGNSADDDESDDLSEQDMANQSVKENPSPEFSHRLTNELHVAGDKTAEEI